MPPVNTAVRPRARGKKDEGLEPSRSKEDYNIMSARAQIASARGGEGGRRFVELQAFSSRS